MHSGAPDVRHRLRLAGIFVLLAGACAALAIDLTAEDSATSLAGYRIVIVDGQTYRVPLADSKAYVHELRRFGGKAAVLFDEFSRWFAQLWVGKALAVTVLWISIIASAALFGIASLFAPDDAPGDERGQPPQGPAGR